MAVADELSSERGGSSAAFPYVQRALELEPQHIGANESMAHHHMRSGKFSEALPYVEWVAQSRPNAVFARMMRGQVWKGLGRLEEAADEFQETLKLAPNSPGLWIMLGETLSALGRHAEAAEAYARRLALRDVYLGPTGYANDPEAALAYGRELYRTGKKEAAREVWREVAALGMLSQKTRMEAERLLTVKGNK